MVSDLQAAAIEAAKFGLRVFPLRPRSKEPRMQGGFKNATNDPGYVGGLWSQWPDSNIGLDLPDGVVVVDIDEEDGTERVRDLDLPSATTVIRTARGFQGFYRLPEGRTVRQGPLDGVGDLKVAGAGYVLLPESVHPSGAVYSFAKGSLQGILDPPPLTEEHVKAIERLRGGTTSTGKAAPLPDTIPAGQRNHVLASLAGTMRRVGATEDEILSAISTANENRCQPPLDADEVEKIAKSIAGRYEPAPPKLAVVEVADRWVLQALAQATPRQVQWLVRGLIPLKYLTLIAAIGGQGKTTYMLGVAARGSVAEKPWDTIYVSFEDTADEVLNPRVQAAGGDLLRVHELVLSDADALDSFTLPRDVENLQQLVQDVSAKLVVIDPIVAAVDAKLDSYKDQHVRQVLAQLWRVAREENCAIGLVGHLNRVPSTDAYLRIANSSAFWNAARSVVLITEEGEEDDGKRLITQRKANLARLAPVERHVLEDVVLPDTIDTDTGKRIVASRMRFIEVAEDVDPSGILGPSKPTKIETTETLLDALLADGEWHESEGVTKLMGAAGFSKRTVQRAAKDIGVEHKYEGFPAKSWWRCPVAPNAVAPTTEPEFGATVDSAQPGRTDAPAVPVAPSDERSGATGATGEIEAETCLVCGSVFVPNVDGARATACASCVGGWES
jgi:AAA domain/Bifunctional DNA primase/polymerase, N-terminal/Primase C terminal 1 (PriCT-1)